MVGDAVHYLGRKALAGFPSVGILWDHHPDSGNDCRLGLSCGADAMNQRRCGSGSLGTRWYVIGNSMLLLTVTVIRKLHMSEVRCFARNMVGHLLVPQMVA